MTSVSVEWIEEGMLCGSAREHKVTMDRLPEGGGENRGFTSRELLLLSIGSCVVGSVRASLQQSGASFRLLCVRVALEDEPEGDREEHVLVDLKIDGAAADHENLLAAAGTGRVTRFLRRPVRMSMQVKSTEGDSFDFR